MRQFRLQEGTVSLKQKKGGIGFEKESAGGSNYDFHCGTRFWRAGIGGGCVEALCGSYHQSHDGTSSINNGLKAARRRI